MFVSTDVGHPEIYVMNPDGTGRTRLTKDDVDGNVSPAFSRDGRKIVFYSNREGASGLYSINADGSGEKRLTHAEAGYESPAFSPDGTTIACGSDWAPEGTTKTLQIHTMTSDGLNERVLTHGASYNIRPNFSPDGRKIVFVSDRDSTLSAKIWELYLMNSDGSSQTRLTHDGKEDSFPVFSPDGSRIAFVAHDDDRLAQIVLMRSDGTGRKRLGSNSYVDGHPSFSPDGSRIVFDSLLAQPSDDSGQGIYVMHIDGTFRRRITMAEPYDDWAAWGPGKPIVTPFRVVFPTPTPLPALPLKRVTNPAAANALQLVATAPWRGQLLYAYTEGHSPPVHYFVRQRLPEKSQGWLAVDDRHASTTYNASGLRGELQLGGELSPDGKYALLQTVTPAMGGRSIYWSHLWELANNLLQPVTQASLNSYFLSWSPDSNFLLYQTLERRGVLPGFEVIGLSSKQPQHITSSAMGIGWAAPHQVIFSQLPEAAGPTMQSETGKLPPVSLTRPNIYLAAVDHGGPELFIRDGQMPTVSPNGQWIAFFGSADVARPLPLNGDWQQRPAGAPLSIIRRDGTGRRALTTMSGVYPLIVWQPDNLHFLTLQHSEEENRSKVEINEWDVVTERVRRVANLGTKGRSEIQWQLGPLKVTRDGKYLVLTMNEPAAPAATSTTFNIQAVNLASGVVTTLARLTNESGLDWTEGPP